MTDALAPERPSPRHRIEPIFWFFFAFLPLSWYFAFAAKNHVAAFITSILAIVPLARVIGYATREICLQANPTVGGLVNATFGNAIELIVSLLALHRGLHEMVQASIIGSIVGNILLLTGLSVFAGGMRFKEQTFNKDSVGVSSTMLIIAVAALALPSLYALGGERDPAQLRLLSDSVAVVMAAVYIAGLVFSFVTHKHLFDASDEIKASLEAPTISLRRAAGLLLITTAAVALESEILARDVEMAAASLGLSQTFIGLVGIAIVTNIAEKANAVHFAMQNKLDISLEIGLSSAIQIALFVVPALVFASHALGYDFSLVFSGFEIAGMLFAVMIVNHLSADGRCNWLEGVQLVSVYLIIAIAFFFIGR